MDISCKRCGAALTIKDIRVEQNLAVCGYCGAVMRFAQQADSKEFKQRPPAPMPEKFRIQRGPAGISWTWRWLTPVHIFMLVFCIAWNSFLLFWFGFGIFGAGQMGPMVIIMLLFPIVHVVVGVGLTYYTICGFVNSSTLAVSKNQISVTHKPLPWPGNLNIHSRHVRQLFTELKLTRHKNGQSESYSVNYVNPQGQKKTLLSGLQEADQALYIEQQIEQYLGIKDAPVAGELERT